LLRQLVTNKIQFIGDKNYYKLINEVSTCIVNDKEKCKSTPNLCVVTDNGTCNLILPERNLITNKENEPIYFGRMADELIRYNRIKSFMFQPQTYLSFGNISYNLRDNEIILIQSTLTQEYFENLVPAVTNKYVKTIRESRINISFLRKINFDTQTSRTAEIPAAGGFLLTEDSFNHREIFGNLSKKILFNSNKDLLKKINFYLKNTKNRKSTAQRTQKVILNIIPSYEKKIENLLKTKTYYPYVNFLSKPRFNLMKAYYTLIHIIKKKYYTKTFDNFKECQNFCKKKIRECYDNYNLNYYRYNEFIFNSRKIHMLKSKGFNILKKIVMKNNKNNKILEIGGGFGADYLNLKKILKLKLNYTIMETKSIVNIMKDKSYCDFFTFNKNIFKKNFDIVYSSSSLQYFSNPELVYRLIFQSFPKYIILVNNNFSYNPKSISQYSCYSQN
jgi:putative methyltransferase (TIGR04325 family)